MGIYELIRLSLSIPFDPLPAPFRWGSILFFYRSCKKGVK